jgi:voltage-gated potassium channel
MRYLVGDATDPDVLAQLGVAHAKGLISTLPSEKDNLIVTVLARQKNHGMRIVVRSTDQRFADKLLKAGATSTVSTQQIGGRRLASELLRPNVTGFLELMREDKEHTLRIDEIQVPNNSPWIGKCLRDIDLSNKYHLLPLAIRNPHSHPQARTFWVNPPEVVSLCKGSVLIVLGEVQDVERARRDSAVSLHPQLSGRHE